MIVAEADLLCGDFLSEESCRHKLLVSTSFWLVLTTECFFSFDIFEIHSAAFLVCYCNVGMLTDHGSITFLFLFFMCLKYVFFLCSALMRFLWYKVFHFPGQCVAS